MWETICDAWACWSGWNFGPNPTEYPYSVKYPPSPSPLTLKWKLSESPNLSVPEYPPPNENCQSVQIRLSQNTPHFGKLQIWDDHSLLWNTPPPPISENFRFEMTKVYSEIPPPPLSENPGDRMWRLICNPQGYHSLLYWSMKLTI